MSNILEMDQEIESCLDTIRFLNESTDDYLFVWDIKRGKLHFTSDIHERFAIEEQPEEGYDLADWNKIVYDKDLPALKEDLGQVERGNIKSHNLEYRIIDREGNRIWINCRGKSQLGQDGRPQFMIGRISDTVMARKVDFLTGLLNGVKFAEDMAECLLKKQQGFLLILDIDNLKDLNNKYGRSYGDEVIKGVSEILEETVDSFYRIYRMDGDKFIINLLYCDRNGAKSAYNIIQDKVALYCTISAGAVPYSEYTDEDSSMLYQYAENALDQAKQTGKNNLIFFSLENYEEYLHRIDLQEELKKSIDNGFQGFYLCYQPQISIEDFRLFGAEALLRFHSPTRGVVEPSEFIPILEQTDWICPVGEWVLRTALGQCKEWRNVIPKLHISVNISYVQLRKKGIAKKVLDILKESGNPGSVLTMEVTESMQLQDYPYFNKIFYQWKKAGIDISVDDFGTGYSSLGYLKSLEINEIKIDRCFISGIKNSTYNYKLLNNMLELAYSAQIRVCCEGVETEEELYVLRKLHPDTIQGFLFGRPYKKEQFEEKYIAWGNQVYWEAMNLETGSKPSLKSIGQKESELIFSKDKLATIVDAMEEAVYVSDIDTYELYYLNPAAHKMIEGCDYKGEGTKCYQVLQGKDAPCEFCTNPIIDKENFYIWEMENTHLGRHFMLKDKLIPWGDKMARMEIAIDVTERELISQDVREKLDFEKNVTLCTKMLIEDPDMNRAVTKTIQSIGEFYKCDRVVIFEPDVDEGHWSNTYEWCNQNINPRQDDMQNVPAYFFRRFLGDLERGSSVMIDDLGQIKEDCPVEWRVLTDLGVCNFLAVPIMKGNKLIGFIVIENPKHRDDNDRQIRIMSHFLADRVIRNEADERLSELLNFRYEDILKATRLGLWIIKLDKKSGIGKMYADHTMLQIMGIKKKISAAECYDYWYGRINDGYYNYVNLAIDEMIHKGNPVQLEYTWNHPDHGEVVVRCMGVRVQDDEGMISLEGYHCIISDMEMPRFFTSTLANEMFEYNEIKKSIYFHTERSILFGGEKREQNFPDCWIDTKIVHQNCVKEFKSIFYGLNKNKEIEGAELLLKTKKGDYEWFRLETHRLGMDDKDIHTIVVSLTPAAKERTMELNYIRKNDFYEALLSEAAAYAEIDISNGQIKNTGGLWKKYEEESRWWGESFSQTMRRNILLSVYSGDVEIVNYYMDADVMRDLYENKNSTIKLCFRHFIDGELRWVEMTIHLFKEKYTNNMYALLYLKNIDLQKKREIAQVTAASIDPLTQVYNRRSFEEKVKEHIESEEFMRGAFLLIDLDDFKVINDKFGHLAGDEALKYLARLLVSTFRKDDVVGRLGGDEFFVFVKNVSDREIMNRRLDALYQSLKDDPDMPISCSTGVVFVERDGFSFEKSLKCADIALYRSKNAGKAVYSYYEDFADTIGS